MQQRRLVISLVIFCSGLNANDYIIKMAEKQYQKNQPNSYKQYHHYKEEKKLLMAEKEKTHKALIYFTSASVPGNDFISTVKDVIHNTDDVQVYPIVRGIQLKHQNSTSNFSMQNMLQGIYDALQSVAPQKRKKISQTAGPIKVNPTLFKKLGIEKVPAVVTATCKNKQAINNKNCVFHVLARGMTSLKQMAALSGRGNNINALFQEKIQ